MMHVGNLMTEAHGKAKKGHARCTLMAVTIDVIIIDFIIEQDN